MQRTIGERIKYLRECHELTQEELAAELFTTRDTIAKLETNTRRISLSTLIEAAKYFNVSTDYLLGRADIAYPDTRIKPIADVLGISEESVMCLMLTNGKLQTDPEDKPEADEYVDELQQLLNLLIPKLPSSYLIREFSNLLVLYKSATQFESNDTKGSWIDIDGELPNTVTIRSGEAVNFYFHSIASEITTLLKEAMSERYGDHMPNGGKKHAQKKDNP